MFGFFFSNYLLPTSSMNGMEFFASLRSIALTIMMCIVAWLGMPLPAENTVVDLITQNIKDIITEHQV